MTNLIELFKKYKHLIALSLIAILSFTLNFYAISKIGYGNAYYAAAIKSMSESFHNFFYVSFDPAGLVSVDKPPLALWIQTIFVLIFGYHGWAMLLPQALAGTGSSIMMYILTAKRFGRPAGLISALVFAVTPAVVVASRNNTMDMQLILCLLVATWFLFSAIEKSKKSHLFLAALFIGLGFNIKMLQAYMIIPAVVIVYFIFSKEKFLKRLINSLISLVIMAVISFAWVVAVDLTPASQRPYVDSSTNNTVRELIVGHNGVERLVGQGGGMNMSNRNNFGSRENNGNGTPPSGGNFNPPSGNNGDSTSTSGNFTSTNGNATPPNGNGRNGNNFPGSGYGNFGNFKQGGGISGNEIGNAGVLRLWSSSLYGQASWLIILALFCIVVRIGKFSLKNVNIKQGIFVYWMIWLVTMYAFFSFAGFYHRYYLCMFAPALAGLIGPGIVEMYRYFRAKKGIKQFLLPVSLIATFIPEIIYVWSYSQLRSWLTPIMIAAFGASLILMAFNYMKPKAVILKLATVMMLVSVLAAPFYWALTVVIYPSQNSTMPYAGPELSSTAEVRGMTPNQENLTTGDNQTLSLEKYLAANYKEGSYLVVSQRSDDVAQFIVDTGLPAVAYGGFLGSDNSMTVDKLKELVKEGKVTYFMVSNQMGGNSSSDLISYVKQNATLVSPSEYGGSSSDSNSSDGRGDNQSVALYLFTSSSVN